MLACEAVNLYLVGQINLHSRDAVLCLISDVEYPIKNIVIFMQGWPNQHSSILLYEGSCLVW